MSPEQWRCTRRTMLRGAVLALAGGVLAGCDEELGLPPTLGASVTIGCFHIVGIGMYEAFKRWRESLIDVDRALIEALIAQKDLLIHIFLATGRLPDRSRGGESSEARYMKQICDFHPIVGQFAPERDWDVAYDPERTKWFEEKYKIRTPPEVVLHHEIFGHVLPGLNDPKLVATLASGGLLDESTDCKALYVENKYRRQLGLREVPPEMIECPSP